jgi:hypothetical protein
MQNFSFIASTQTDLGFFLTLFQEHFRIQKHPNMMNMHIYVGTAKFQLSSFYPDELFDIFSRKFHNFLEELFSEFQKHPNLSILFDAATSKGSSCKISTL